MYGLPPIGRTVKYLVLINMGVFVLQAFLDRDGWMSRHFGVTVAAFWQVWRYVTSQFLHGGFWHISLNMLGLYFLGSPLESLWGPRRFLTFYLGAGAAAGLTYVIMGALLGPSTLSPEVPIIGASGGVYALVLACAVLFPDFKLIFLFFPVPIRLAALIIFGGMVFMLLSSLSRGVVTSGFWSDVAHLGGAAAGAVGLWILPRLHAGAFWRRTGVHRRMVKSSWKRKMEKRSAEQSEIDRILQKIHDEGLNSLTRKERKTLADATRHQQQEDQELRKT